MDTLIRYCEGLLLLPEQIGLAPRRSEQVQGAGWPRAAALTGGAQLASPGRDVKLHWAGSHIRAISGIVILCLSCWGRSNLSQHFQVLQDNLQREGRCGVIGCRGRRRVSFPF